MMTDRVNYNQYIEETSFSSDLKDRERTVENVLVMQGGGSLGAFACGVFKGLIKRKIRIDIAAGTSIGAVNAAIIAGSKSDHPEHDLEDFWMELAESNYHIIPDIYMLDYDTNTKKYVTRNISSASANAAVFGVPKMFIPRWLRSSIIDGWPEKLISQSEAKISSSLPPSFLPYSYFDPRSWTYSYDHSPLARTLDKYIDYRKLNLARTKEKLPEVVRLIITAVDVLTAKPLIFDNTEIEIQPKHILASTGYPLYGFPWIKIESTGGNGLAGKSQDVYAWDGSLLSNTPIREVLNRSPRNDKHIFVVENYPKSVHRLPANLAEVESRAKDILFSDKNMDTIRMSKLVTRQIQLIKKLYSIFETSNATDQLNPHDVNSIKSEYNRLIENYGAEILSITKIVRSEIESPTILQNADFSPMTVKKLIVEGERKTRDQLGSSEITFYDAADGA